MMWSKIAFRVFAFFSFALAIRQHVCCYPREGFGVFLSFEAITLTEINHVTIQVCASECSDSVQVRKSHFSRFRVTPHHLCVLFGADQKSLVAYHLTVKTPPRL